LLASRPESRLDVVLRDGWDGKPLRNVVKGKTADGISNSLICMEPHLSISGDTTRHELISKMPDGADENGFGNRFLYVYVYRIKLCPLGGPEIDWSNDVLKLYDVIQFARKQGCVGLTPSAKIVWTRMYAQIENSRLQGLAGKMTSRAAAHIRRLALIYAMLDMSSSVGVKHLRAAQLLWEYCEESARYIFNGTTRDQIKLLRWMEKQSEPMTLSTIREEFYQRHKKVEQIKSIVADLVMLKLVKQSGETYSLVK
jgi:DNA replicative helicase MCM subunit Mcm2 (Cdc46/Mcm family)